MKNTLYPDFRNFGDGPYPTCFAMLPEGPADCHFMIELIDQPSCNRAMTVDQKANGANSRVLVKSLQSYLKQKDCPQGYADALIKACEREHESTTEGDWLSRAFWVCLFPY